MNLIFKARIETLDFLNKKRQYVFMLSLMGLGLVLSIAGFVAVQSRENHLAHDGFEVAAKEKVAEIKNDFETNLEVLHNLRSLYSSTDVVTREHFNSFVAHPLSTNPNIQALEWIPRVSAGERPAYEENAQLEGYAGYQIIEREESGALVPAGTRREHFPVYFVEPIQGNENALGFDLASDPTRLEALVKARDTGQPVATERITLVQESGDIPGFLVFLPVYHNGSPSATLVERQENLNGFVLGVYRSSAIASLAPNTAGEEGFHSDLDISVYDRSAQPGDQLFTVAGPGGIDATATVADHRFSETFTAAGRTWEIVVTSSETTLQWQPWALLAGGLLLTGLLMAYVLASLGRTSTVESLVGQRTQELSQANQQLLEEAAVRRQVEVRLQTSEAGLRAILGATVDGIITIDEKGSIESFNAAAEGIFGHSEAEIIGKNVKVLMPDPRHSSHDGYLANYARTGEKGIMGATREVEGQTKDGSIFPMDLAVNEVQLPDRKIFTGIVRDISERKQLESEIIQYTESLEHAYKELQQLDELKDNFLSSVSHELRTPLTAIKGSAEILLDGEGVDERIHQEFLSIINSECDRLTRLINDVLDLARMDAGQERWDDGQHSMADIVATSVSGIQTLAMQKEIKVSVDLDPDLPAVWADKDKILQVLTNLLSNAIKFTYEGGRVEISGRQLPAESAADGEPAIEIKVSDNGIGMEPGDLETIFEKFKQVGDIPSDVHQGTGLGLPICKEIVGHYQGEIWCDSEPGKGSVFTFSIPVYQGVPVAEPPVSEQSALTYQSTSQKTILVVDDEVNVRRLLHHEFTKQGYLVLEAENGGTAIDLAREHRPDLITMDVLMPVLDGYDAIKLIKGDPVTKDIPILVLSIVENQEMGIDIGANQFISKPFAVEEMLESVSRLLDGPAKKVLIADDDKVLAETLKFQLEQRGFVPSVAYDGKEVLESIDTEPPDLVVLDLNMPEVDGFETLTEMKRRPETANIPVIVLSGLEIDGVKVRALSLGATYFVPKAEGFSKLHQEIESILSD